MFCAPKECTLSELACLENRLIAINAMRKVVRGKSITLFEIDRIVMYKSCSLTNSGLAEKALQRMYRNIADKFTTLTEAQES